MLPIVFWLYKWEKEASQISSKKQRKAAKKRKQKAATDKIKQPENELMEHLKREIRFISRSSKAFDSGDVDEARIMASRIRLLVHDTTPSHSLLGQLEKKDCLFYDSARPRTDGDLGPYHGLVGMEFGPKPRWGWIPLLFSEQNLAESKKPFDAWWNATILDDNHGICFSRKEIVLTVCHEDGGVHVDPELKGKYVKMEKSKEFAFVFTVGGKEIKPRLGPGLASVRQIGFELMMTLSEEFPRLLRGKYLRPKSETVVGPNTTFIGGLEFKQIDDPDKMPDS